MVVDKLYIDGRLYQEELEEGKPEGATAPRMGEVHELRLRRRSWRQGRDHAGCTLGMRGEVIMCYY